MNSKKARKFARKLNALGKSSVVRGYFDDFPDNPEADDHEDVEKSPFKTPRETICDTSRSNILTRNVRKKLTGLLDSNQNVLSVPSVASSFGMLSNKSTQTESLCLDDVSMPAVSTRKKPVRQGAKKSSLCHEAYLQAGFLMCAVGNQSPSQAVMNMMIIDTQIYKQKRTLPLVMQKRYQLQIKRLKKLRAGLRIRQSASDDAAIVQDAIIEGQPDTGEGLIEQQTEQNDSDSAEEEECDDTILFETEIDIGDEHECHETAMDYDSPPTKKSKLDKGQEYVAQTKYKQKLHLDQVLPDPRSIRRAHHQAASYLEGEIGSKMVQDGKTFLMPDGTSRAKVGKMGATLVKIEGKMRALKLQCMGNEQRENWADTIIHQIQRLSVASNESTEDIYRSICSLVSDSCKVNKGLAALISAKLGLEWVPGQLYCLIHSVLGFQDGISKTWLKYQEEIGHEKLYPSITGFEMDVEEKGLIKHILEMYLRSQRTDGRLGPGIGLRSSLSSAKREKLKTWDKNYMETGLVSWRSVALLLFTLYQLGKILSQLSPTSEISLPSS